MQILEPKLSLIIYSRGILGEKLKGTFYHIINVSRRLDISCSSCSGHMVSVKAFMIVVE